MKPSAWAWHLFQGSAEALRYNRRELPHLDAAIALTRGRTAAVQAGGNLGIYPKRLSMKFKTVYTFEPAHDLWPIMLHNAPEPNIVKYQAALGYERELIAISRERRDGKPNAHEGIGYVVPNGTIPTLRIDDLNLPVCDLVYLDIEGAELNALKGSVETLARCRPAVGVEVNKNLGFVGLTKTDLIGFIETQGYRLAEAVGSDRIFVPMEWGEA